MEYLFGFLRRLFAERFHGTVTIEFKCGKVTHVVGERRCSWTCSDLPAEPDDGARDV